MPVSDAVRSLLAARSVRNPPPDAPAKPDPEPALLPEREPDRTGYRERARREAERFRLATDSEYWIALCFRQPGDPDRFCRAAGIIPDRRRIPGQALPGKPAKPHTLSRARRMLTARSLDDPAARLAGKPAPDPLDGLPEAPGLEQASADELDALLTALTAPPDPNPANVLDSPHWVAAWWPDRDAKDAWLTATGVDVLGDKYIDGHQAAELLGITL